MIKKYIIFTLTLAFLFGGILFVSAEEENNNTAGEPTVQQLLAQIQALTAQIQTLQQQVQHLMVQQQTLEEEVLALTRQLQEGMRGEDVKALQQMLATDPEIYPEGLITGYFGPMTKRAVQRFQKKAGIDQAGRVGPQTLWRVNQILNEGGVGPKGHIPPGLLKAPGIQRLMGEKHPLVAECSSIKPCPQEYYCLTGKCVKCIEDKHCEQGYICEENKCVEEAEEPECVDNADCEAGHLCEDGECVPEEDNGNNGEE